MPLMIASSTMMSVTTTAAAPSTSRQDSVLLRRIPERLRPRPCKICNKIISNASNMIKHMLVHNPVKIPFRCNLCDCKYSREETLRWHLKVKHGIIRPALGRDSYLQEITIDSGPKSSSWMSSS
uniref:C2H2-type domain-containing protein n=1 Tax=Strigamia maritima TaxID=126957 RepID=T1IXC5_STRMM